MHNIVLLMLHINDAHLPRGSYSTVFKCRTKVTDYEYAAKVVEVTTNSGLQKRAYQEAELLRELSHPCIVHLEDSFDNETKIILVMELYVTRSAHQNFISLGV